MIMPNIRELNDNERADLAEQSCCQDGDDAAPGDNDFDQDGGV